MEDIPLNQLNLLTNSLQARLNEALSSITQQQANISLSVASTMQIIDAHDLFEHSSEKNTAVYIPLMGDIVGDIFLFLDDHSDIKLADLMIGNPAGTTNIIGEFESSAIQELGNILTGVVVTEMANMLGLSMILTVPNIANDMVGAVIDQVLITYGESSQEFMAIKFPFAIEQHNIKGAFLLMFDKTSSELIESKIKTLQN